MEIILLLAIAAAMFVCGVHYERARLTELNPRFEPHRPRLLALPRARPTECVVVRVNDDRGRAIREEETEAEPRVDS